MTDEANAVCQDCGGNVTLEVSFTDHGGLEFYAECRDCHLVGWADLSGVTG